MNNLKLRTAGIGCQDWARTAPCRMAPYGVCGNRLRRATGDGRLRSGLEELKESASICRILTPALGNFGFTMAARKIRKCTVLIPDAGFTVMATSGRRSFFETLYLSNIVLPKD